MTKHQRHNRKRRASPETNDNLRRVRVGDLYVGMTRTPEAAKALNDFIRKELHDR